MTETYRDPARSPAERAADLCSRMDLEEKLAQLQCCMPVRWPEGKLAEEYPRGVGQVAGLAVSAMGRSPADVAAQVRRLQTEIMAAGPHHIPAIFHMETLCGLLMPGATAFPTGIAQGATWDPALQLRAGVVIARQAKATGFRQAFAPVLDVSADPRFGRQGESCGEDPTLCAAMGAAYTRGLQADGALEQGVAATSKHFLAYHTGVAGIHAAHNAVSSRELRECYAKPFQAAIRAGLRSVMNSYGSIDGEPVVGSRRILTGLLREEMGFTGVTVSDYTAVEELYTKHKVAPDLAQAGLRALRSGMDCDLPGQGAYAAMAELFRSGQGDQAALDAAVTRLLTLKFELGLFEQPFPEEEAIAAAFDGGQGHEVALQQARESLVLLKNDGLLPLSLAGKRIALVGYHGASTVALFGGYTMVSMAESFAGAASTMDGVGGQTPDVTQVWNAQSAPAVYPGTSVRRENPGLESFIHTYAPHTRTLLAQLQAAGAEVRYAYGYDYAGTDEQFHDEALALCADSDLVIVTLGGKYGWSNTCTTGEGIDSVEINLPPCQESFLRKLAALHKPTVGLHFDGRPLSSDAADELGALIECWNPGEGGSQAIVEALTGAYNPGGKLPVSVLYEAGQAPLSYRHPNGGSYHVTDEDAHGETARHYTTRPFTPRYFFGHGLSYTTFDYGPLTLDTPAVSPEGTVTASVRVTNTGTCAGDEVVQLYARDPVASMVRPAWELVGFARVPLQPGESKTVSFRLHPSQLAFLDEDNRWKIEAGEICLQVGGGFRDVRSTASFTITADQWIEGSTRALWAD